jgi:hypothetical protein
MVRDEGGNVITQEAYDDVLNELRFAITACANWYFWNGHYRRVADKYGLPAETELTQAAEEWKNWPKESA